MFVSGLVSVVMTMAGSGSWNESFEGRPVRTKAINYSGQKIPVVEDEPVQMTVTTDRVLC